MTQGVVKTWRYWQIYGLRRTLYKVAGRTRLGAFASFGLTARNRSIGVIGCGQFSFATIGYFVSARTRQGFAACYDIDSDAARSFARFYRVPHTAASAQQVIGDAGVDLIYIASNHASHAPYAVAALKQGKSVYVEKPMAVSIDQLAALVAAVNTSSGRLFVGYNRPFSKAVRRMRECSLDTAGPITLACFISGHQLPHDHWYRRDGEGTRICGNVGHWIDLAIHLLSLGKLPDRWNVSISWANPVSRDDDVAIALTSSRGDLINIVITSRTEPFEGINETINLQWGDLIAKIEDFRSLTIWQGSKITSERYRPKDVGHEAAILQPFRKPDRDLNEVVASTLLMLYIASLVQAGEPRGEFSFAEAQEDLSRRAELLRSQHIPDIKIQ